MPWVFCLAKSKVMEHEHIQGHDLDFAIKRECLRLEIQRRVGEEEVDAAEAARYSKATTRHVGRQ